MSHKDFPTSRGFVSEGEMTQDDIIAYQEILRWILHCRKKINYRGSSTIGSRARLLVAREGFERVHRRACTDLKRWGK